MVNEKPNVKPTSKFSATETANILGINRKTLYRHTKLGYTLHYSKVQRKTKIQRFRDTKILGSRIQIIIK